MVTQRLLVQKQLEVQFLKEDPKQKHHLVPQLDRQLAPQVGSGQLSVVV